MVGIDLEAEPATGLADELIKEGWRCLEHLAAVLADQVAMGLRGQVVGGGSLPGVAVLDDAEALELFEDPVHSGAREVRALLLDQRGELLGGEVARVRCQDLEEGTLGGGGTPSRFSHGAKRRFDHLAWDLGRRHEPQG